MKLKPYILSLLITRLSVIPLISAQPPAFTLQKYLPAPHGYFFLSVFEKDRQLSTAKLYHLIIESNGHTVYYNKLDDPNADFKLQYNGLITYFIRGWHHLMDSSFHIIDSVSCRNGITTDMHDMQVLADGHYLLLGYETVEMDLSGYRAYSHFTKKNMRGDKNTKVVATVFQELDRKKKVVFEWHAKDHFRFDDMDESFFRDSAEVDWIHANSIMKDTDGNYILSSKFFHEITKISRKNGSIIWRFGGKRSQFTMINDTIPFAAQHDVRKLENGNLLFFDNGHRATGKHPARAVEYKLDETAKTARLIWSYTYDPSLFSSGKGNVQRIGNNHTLVNLGTVADRNVCTILVTSKGEKAYELTFNDTLASYRTFFYTSLPFKLMQPAIIVSGEAGAMHLEAEKGYAAYLWSTGDTTRTIRINKPGRYFVYVPAGKSGFISSEVHDITAVQIPDNKK